jgi:hypothetical protein
MSANRSRSKRFLTPAFLADARILPAACSSLSPSLETAFITRDNGEPREPHDGKGLLSIGT